MHKVTNRAETPHEMNQWLNYKWYPMPQKIHTFHFCTHAKKKWYNNHFYKYHTHGFVCNTENLIWYYTLKSGN